MTSHLVDTYDVIVPHQLTARSPYTSSETKNVTSLLVYTADVINSPLTYTALPPPSSTLSHPHIVVPIITNCLQFKILLELFTEILSKNFSSMTISVVD